MSEKESKRSRKINYLINLMEGAESGTSDKYWTKDVNRFKTVTKQSFYNPMIIFALPESHSEDIYFHDATMDLLPPKFDTVFGMFVGEYPFPMRYVRFRTVSPKKLRGQKIFSSRIIELSFCGITDGKYYGMQNVFCQVGNEWKCVNKNTNENMAGLGAGQNYYMTLPTNIDNRPGEELSNLLQLGISVTFSQHYQWSVSFKNSKQLTIRLPVDIRQIKHLFKLREKENEMTRRTALKHWVNSSWRKLPKNNSLEGFWRKYLRGSLDFEWFGMQCKVNIPVSEKKELEKLILNRKIMKIDGTDRRSAQVLAHRT